MEAVRGVFNSDVDRLVMQDKITVATSSGVTGELTHASLDTKTQTLRAHQRVHFELTNGTVKANALTFNSAEHVLTFRGKVMVHITKPQKTADATTGDAKPKQVKAQVPQAADSRASIRLDGVRARGQRVRSRRDAAPTHAGGVAMTAYRALARSYPGATGALAAHRHGRSCLRRRLKRRRSPTASVDYRRAPSRADRHRVRRARGARPAEIRDLQGQRESGAGHDDAARPGARRPLCRRRRQAHRVEQPDADCASQPAQTAATGSAPRRQTGGGSRRRQTALRSPRSRPRATSSSTATQDQTTTSDWALYDVPAQLVTVGGNVVLTQGQNVLKGDRLVIDLKTGESRFENPGNTTAGGRIRALFMPKAQDAKASPTTPSLAKPEPAQSPRRRAPARRRAARRPLTQVPRQRPTAATPRADEQARPGRQAVVRSSPASPNKRGQVLYPMLTGQRFN